MSGDLVTIQLPQGQTLQLPKTLFPSDVKQGEEISLLAIRGADILNEILRDEEAKK